MLDDEEAPQPESGPAPFEPFPSEVIGKSLDPGEETRDD